MKLCFATGNIGKLNEIKLLLDHSFSILSLQDIGCSEELLEEGNTLEENARQKAEYIAEKYNIACFADDTGLEVDALNKTPGVYSARYAGEHKSNEDNMQLLLQNLLDEDNRGARFRTVITLVLEGHVHSFEGILKGCIATEKKGEKGFGYDPVFIPEGHSMSLAEMTIEEKNAISHRRKAMDQLLHFLKKNI